MAQNPYMASELKGLTSNITYAGTNAQRVQQLIDLVSEESTQAMRGHLDMMPPLAQRQLVVELTALKAAMV